MRLWVLSVITTLFVAGCQRDIVSTGPMVSSNPKQANIEYSEGFYYDANTGTYAWNGTIPPGDAAPPDITVALAGAYPPKYGTAGWTTGSMRYYGGDFAQVHLRPYAFKMWYQNGNPLPVPAVTSPWTGASCERWYTPGCAASFTYSASLELTDTAFVCEVTVTASGYARAKKATPYGLPLILAQILQPFSHNDWTPIEVPLEGRTSTGPVCGTAPTESELRCDNPNTPTIEYCPVSGDPAIPPEQGGSGTIYQITLQTRPEPTYGGGNVVYGCVALWKMRVFQGGILIAEYYDGCAEYGWFET